MFPLSYMYDGRKIIFVNSNCNEFLFGPHVYWGTMNQAILTTLRSIGFTEQNCVLLSHISKILTAISRMSENQ